MTASRTTPTLWVLVIMTGPSRKPESSTQCVPVISPLPLRLNQPANTASREFFPRGRIAVTPVRTGPTPTFNAPSPEISVVWPTSTPLMSVIAFSGPGWPSKGTPRSRARGFCPQAHIAEKSTAEIQITQFGLRIQVLQRLGQYSREIMTRRYRRTEMENWKRGLIAGSAGLSLVFLLKGSRTGALIFGGAALATLASEYPEKFAEIRKKLPDYMDRGATFLEVVSRLGERLAEVTESRSSAWVEALLNG